MQFQLEPTNYDDAEDDDDILPVHSPIQSAVLLLQDYCHGQARAAGWWTDLETGLDKERNVGEALMLATSELAEALEGHRKGLHDPHLPKRDNYTVEIADALIAILEYEVRGFPTAMNTWGIKFVKNWRTSRLSLNVRELYALLQQDQ